MPFDIIYYIFRSHPRSPLNATSNLAFSFTMAVVAPVDEWPADYWERVRALCNQGVIARTKLTVEQSFVSLHIKVVRGTVLRDTPWQRHVTLGYDNEISPQLLRRIRRRWSGRITRLRFSWVGSGGAAFLEGCPLSRCRLVKRAHRQGWYKDRALHISF